MTETRGSTIRSRPPGRRPPGLAAVLASALAGMRLQTKLALFGAALVLAGVGLTGAAGVWLIDRQAQRAARERLAAASDFAAAEYESLIENVHITGEVLTARYSHDLLQAAQAGQAADADSLPELAAALAALVRGPRRVEAADTIAVIGRDGTVLFEAVRDRGSSRGGQWPGDEAVAAALAGQTALGVEVFPGGGLRAVAVLPLRSGAAGTSGVAAGADAAAAGAVVGAVAVTSFLDDEAAERVRRITGFDVAFFAGERAVASSARRPSGVPAEAALQRELARVWPSVANGEEAVAEFGGPLQRTLVRYAPLRDTTGDVIGAVGVSAGTEGLGVGRRQTLALFAGAAGAVLALALASETYAARILSQPLNRLVGAVRRIGAGDLTTPVDASLDASPDAGRPGGAPGGARRDEVAELAASIEEMRRLLAAAAEGQAQLARLKDEYLFSVAHELRSPLAALAASVELLAESPGDVSPAERMHLLGIVSRHTAALRGLVDNLLDLGSLRAGRFRVEPCPTPADAVVRQAVEDVAPQLDARRQRVVPRLPSPAPVVEADPRRLRQVLVNLLSNASKYGPEGEAIGVAVEQRGAALRFSVADRGCGIPSDEQALLFDAYFRSEATSRAVPGVGLGLAIVKAIADAHGGRVGVDSAPGEGTCFWVELPAATAEGDPDGGAASAQDGPAARPVADQTRA